jgi:protein-S-isoprenylcysteine O-methyltransferase Ste14
MNTVNSRAWLGLAILGVVMGLLLFLAAGTVRYWQAWGYLAVFFAAGILITLYLIRKDPALLERRLSAGPTAEKENSQKLIMLFASIGFVALLIVPGLDHRFAWSTVPASLVVAGYALTLLGFTVVFLVYRENTFASATIELADGHKVISTGPYAVVRHPMYAGGLLYLAGMPIALGSYWGLLVLPVFIAVLAWRLAEEERFLVTNLPGYAAYQAQVRWRLVPAVW